MLMMVSATISRSNRQQLVKSSDVKCRTRLEWQKEMRYRHLEKRRFKVDNWTNYDVDDDGDDYHQIITNIIDGDIPANDYRCPTNQQIVICQLKTANDTRLLKSTTDWVLNLIDTVIYDNENSDLVVDNQFFDVEFINHLMSLIGSITCISIKQNILKIYDHLIRYYSISKQFIANIMSSQMLKTLITTISSANALLVDQSLQLLDAYYEMTSGDNDIIGSVIPVISQRIESLKWRSRDKTLDLKRSNKPLTMFVDNVTDETRDLLCRFSRFLSLFAIKPETLFADKLLALVFQLFRCPDAKVIDAAFKCVTTIAVSGDNSIKQRLVYKYGQQLLTLLVSSMTTNHQLDAVMAILKLFTEMIDCNTDFFQIFSDNLVINLSQTLVYIMSHNNNKDIEVKLAAITLTNKLCLKLLSITDTENCGQVCNYLLLSILSLIRLYGNIYNDTNRQLLELSIDCLNNVLQSYSIKLFCQLCNTLKSHIIGYNNTNSVFELIVHQLVSTCDQLMTADLNGNYMADAINVCISKKFTNDNNNMIKIY